MVILTGRVNDIGHVSHVDLRWSTEYVEKSVGDRGKVFSRLRWGLEMDWQEMDSTY